MEYGKFSAVAAEIRKLGYKLESMRFSNGKGGEVTLWIDSDDESEIEDKIQELRNKIHAAYHAKDLKTAIEATAELNKLLELKAKESEDK